MVRKLTGQVTARVSGGKPFDRNVRAANPDKQAGRAGTRPAAIARYALLWIALGGVLAAFAIVVLDEPAREATLPPVQQTQLVHAARAAACRLRRAERGQRLVPPADGPPGPAARAGFYDRAPPREQLTAAIRRGVIVIYHRPHATRDRVAQLRALQEAVPTGTIVAPHERMPYTIAAAAYRRLLTCPTFTDAAIDAIRLFRGRHIGKGPDR